MSSSESGTDKAFGQQLQSLPNSDTEILSDLDWQRLQLR